ncbi:serine protease 27-like [Macrotis lagotis]|uniref:serine protease 27-like n=1 Tax=Macrotis lagotis TaxID=92651 RepID=UPI003D68E087
MTRGDDRQPPSPPESIPPPREPAHQGAPDPQKGRKDLKSSGLEPGCCRPPKPFCIKIQTRGRLAAIKTPEAIELAPQGGSPEWPVKLSPYAVSICLLRAGLNFEEKVSCWMMGRERADHKDERKDLWTMSLEDSKPSTMGYEIQDTMLCGGGISKPQGSAWPRHRGHSLEAFCSHCPTPTKSVTTKHKRCQGTQGLDMGLLPTFLLLLLTPTGSCGSDLDKVCGKPKLSGKIMGGQSAPEGKWPWQVSLWYRRRFICGGSLIDSQWVLTAAHCFLKSTDPSMYMIFVGYTKLYEGNSHSLQVSVRKIFRHPNFSNDHPFGSDIALLELSSSVGFSSYILPICLPTPGLYYEEKSSCWITGWGALIETENYSETSKLQEAEIPLMNSYLCNLFYGVQMTGNLTYDIKDDMLCAGDIIHQRAICRGDSGGPLVCEFSETWMQVGIASWGMECVTQVSPSVFSRVSYYLDWIEETKKKAYQSSPTKVPTVRKPVNITKLPQSTRFTSGCHIFLPSQISVLPVLLCQGLLVVL